jgi:hypothetical protein
MIHMCVYMHSRFVENHPIQILKDGSIIYKVVLSQDVPENGDIQLLKPSKQIKNIHSLL